MQENDKKLKKTRFNRWLFQSKRECFSKNMTATHRPDLKHSLSRLWVFWGNVASLTGTGRFPVEPQLLPAVRVTSGGVAFPTLAPEQLTNESAVNHGNNGDAKLAKLRSSS